MQSLRFISVSILINLLMCMPSWANSIFGEKKEVVFFFSYHCTVCYESSIYLSAWDHLNPKIKVRKVPVFSDVQWRQGARLHFLLHFSKTNHLLKRFELERHLYGILSQEGSFDDVKSEYVKLLKKYGLPFTAEEFHGWWVKSEQMMNYAKGILDETNDGSKGMSPPFVRIAIEGRLPVYVDASDPQFVVAQINTLLR